MRILIIGAGGAIGGQLFADLKILDHDVIGTTRPQRVESFPMVGVDLLDMSRTMETLAELGNFESVVFAAGVGDLASCERQQEVSKFVNVKSAVTLCEHFLKTGCSRFVYLSSGRVFSGDRSFVSADGQRDPKSELGRQKSEAEKTTCREQLEKLNREVVNYQNAIISNFNAYSFSCLLKLDHILANFVQYFLSFYLYIL